MIGLALKMLFGDTAKYLMLVAGLFLATFLIVQQASVFCGLMRWTTSTLKNVGAPIWIVEERVEQINETNPLRDTDLARVRSVSEVAWAMPIYSGIQRVRLDDGSLKTIQLIGIDSASLAGAPTRMIHGDLADLRLPGAVIVDELAVERLSEGQPDPLELGDVFEINDIEARVVGICEAKRSFTGGPYVWTTYERALQYTPASRKMLSAVIAGPVECVGTDEAAAAIAKATGLRAFVNRDFGDNPDDFNTSTIWWYVRNTGIPISFGTTVVIGFIVGVAVACQTFYAFVLDNLKHLGALKAMGASNLRLSAMLIVQAFTVGIIGFGLGLAAGASFATGAMESGQPPLYIPWIIPVGVLGVILFICSLAALLGILRLSRFEPAMVFRT
ncbi:MAG: FtsX-like permease family protein [Verrucomicrobia bacterium]|nr:MAG: FtsX-like permease family protein [Verrucomicrobiota bacterium]TAE87136.1 MAG: FtsX-like permease family protein [Verrucomicrobiota bacterium]TAF24940.1 MAG: FtsX-like permease family protein [Verrucomicrobiota bacterium]TAF40733.1 MAG: FtsX-like permease family protein [Verrucomicrobiota bacterium]